MSEKPRDPALDPDPEEAVEGEPQEGKEQGEGKDRVDERSEESFPASDPPSY